MIEKGEKKKAMTNREIQIALVENFVNMQKVLTNLSVKFDMLSDNMSRLLQVFEIAARNFIKKSDDGTLTKDDKALLEKLDVLVDQNRTIAKGLTLVEEKMRHKLYSEENTLKRLPPRPIERTNPQETAPNLSERPRPKPLPRI